MRFVLPFLLLCTTASAQVNLIPLPANLDLQPGRFDLTKPVTIVVNSKEIMPEGELLRKILADALPVEPGLQLEQGPVFPEQFVYLAVPSDAELPKEGYKLRIATTSITLSAADRAGLYHGISTLEQLLPGKEAQASLPCLNITDHPRFPWRGMHLDVCRHFFDVDFVKRYIDLLARYKMNTFHWHLTEDQGWRIEIKKYPKLTEVGAWRSGSQVGPYSRREYDSVPYGGFYTQEQIKEVVAYAAARHITVVPEIEMPGHAMAALASYPQLGCTGGPYEVQKGWGVFDDVFCAGNDSVFTVLEDVLTEVMALFPGQYIHIGGDECPKERWKTCAKCQARMKSNGLKDEHELQSYFIQRIEKFVNSKGRKIIGWDEILEGGLAPNAAVMSWRGTEGGVAAAKEKHNVVMTPGSHCYFDHYQGDPANEPLAIGGYTTVQKVYSYEPIPAELKPEEAKYILGAQGNVWTEYILRPENVEYMAVPRMLALAEVLWTPKAKRDEKGFIVRLENELPKLDAMKVNASKSLYQVSIRPKQGPKPGEIAVEMKLATGGSFSMTEMAPPYDERMAGLAVYSAPVIINSDRELHGWIQREGLTGPIAKRRFLFNKATARPITLSVQPNERYNDGGAFTLVDGITAQEKRVSTEWLGWREGVTITVDLGSVQDVRTVSIGALNETYSWIHTPERVDLSVSEDGKTFTPFGSAEVKAGVGRNAFTLEKAGKARFVRFTVKHRGKIPEGYPGAGNPAWMFLDEIEVR
ncbi:MAG: family 20 glycosylhydrolase [Flavobacteriales bacterium]|nr:family 20 glycosylhydrolase [Flavobacteriales bacterium]